MDDIAQTVETLGDSVDWVIIGNRVKIPTTKFFRARNSRSNYSALAPGGFKFRRCFRTPAIICARGKFSLDGGCHPPRR
jgi:hypothetical protein